MKAISILLAAVALAVAAVFVLDGRPGRRETPPGAAAVPLAEPDGASAKVVEIRRGGQEEDLAAILAPGQVTIVDFFADWCGPCRAMDPKLRRLVASRPGVSLRKVDIVDWQSPIVRQRGIRFVPYVAVYDRAGSLVGPPTASISTVEDYVAKALANPE